MEDDPGLATLRVLERHAHAPTVEAGNTLMSMIVSQSIKNADIADNLAIS